MATGLFKRGDVWGCDTLDSMANRKENRHTVLTLRMQHCFLQHGEKREIPINHALKKTLVNLTRRLDVHHVFYDPKTGKPYKNIKHSFQTALRRSKIKDFHFYYLRHTFASHLVGRGRPYNCQGITWA
jgi:integrase